MEYGSIANERTLVLNDFAPWSSTKLEDFRIVRGKAEVRGYPNARIYLANASMGKHRKFPGAVYGLEHIDEREKARELPTALHRGREILYTSEALHVAFEAPVRNINDLVEEGIRRMLSVTRKLIRRESSAEYALSPREDGPPALVFRNSFDVRSKTGCWQAKFTPRFEAIFENGSLAMLWEMGYISQTRLLGRLRFCRPVLGTLSCLTQFL